MDNFRGICTSCGITHSGDHVCSAEYVRLREIDQEAGPRAVREEFLALGKKGYNNKIEKAEVEAVMLRLKLAK
jgi:hypothetical protein